MSSTLEYYAYLSEHQIERLFEQIPEKVLPQIAVELGFDLKILTAKVTVSPNENKIRIIKNHHQESREGKDHLLR